MTSKRCPQWKKYKTLPNSVDEFDEQSEFKYGIPSGTPKLIVKHAFVFSLSCRFCQYVYNPFFPLNSRSLLSFTSTSRFRWFFLILLLVSVTTGCSPKLYGSSLLLRRTACAGRIQHLHNTTGSRSCRSSFLSGEVCPVFHFLFPLLVLETLYRSADLVVIWARIDQKWFSCGCLDHAKKKKLPLNG